MKIDRKDLVLRGRLKTPNDLIVVGVDPGFASTGVAVLGCTPKREFYIIRAVYIPTSPSIPMKEIRKSSKHRVMDEDLRRYVMIARKYDEILKLYQPKVIGVEAYVLNRHQIKVGSQNDAIKAMAVYGCIVGLSGITNAFVRISIAASLANRFLQTRKSEKFLIQDSVCAEVDGLAFALNKSLVVGVEHIADAAGHGIIATEWFWKANTGVKS